MSNLAWNQRRLTRIELENELRARGHSIPSDDRWHQKELSTGIGIYNTEEKVLSSWLIDSGDEYGGR